MSIPEDEVQCLDGSTAPLGQCPPASPASSGSGGSGGSGGHRRSSVSSGGDHPTKIILKRGTRGTKVKKWQRILNVHAINRLNYGVGEHAGALTKAQSLDHLQELMKSVGTGEISTAESDSALTLSGDEGAQGGWVAPYGTPESKSQVVQTQLEGKWTKQLRCNVQLAILKLLQKV